MKQHNSSFGLGLIKLWEYSMPDLARKVKADSGDSGVGSKKIEQPR